MEAKFFLNIQKTLAVQIIAWSVFIALLPNIIFAQSSADSSTVKSIVEKYQEAWDTHDSYKLVNFFTEDADFVMGNLPSVHGYKAIQGFWEKYFKRQEPGRKLKIDINSFKTITDSVLLINVSTTTWGNDDQGKELQRRKFRGTWVLNKQVNGDWLIVAMLGIPTEQDLIIRPSDN